MPPSVPPDRRLRGRRFGIGVAAGGGVLLTVLALAALTAILQAIHAPHHPDTFAFLYLAVVVLAAIAFGVPAALAGALTASVLVDVYFLPPVGHLTIYSTPQLVGWIVFFSVCLGVGILAAGRRRHLADLRRASLRLAAANAELRRAGNELSTALGARTELARTEAALAATRRAETFRRDLLATVSHELRTPLAALLGHTTALAVDPGRVGLRHPEYVDTVVAEARRIDRLISDLLDLARIETGQLQVETEVLDLGEAAIEASRRWRDRLQVGLVTVPTPVLVLGDWDRVQQLLDNALANVQRHSGTREATIRVVAPSVARVTAAECVVQDHGRGIPDSARSRLFERYSSSGPTGGLGLGLSVSRGLAEAMGGGLWVDSTAQSGTELHFLLPLATAVQPGVAAAVPART